VTPQRISTPEVVTVDDLKDLAAAGGPCVTVAMKIPDPLHIRTHIKNGIRGLEKSLHDFGVDERTTATLMGPIQSLASSVEAEGQWRRDLILFRSPNIFRYFSVPELTREFADVGNHFQVRPLLSVIGFEQRFHVLALSQKHVRLLRCTYRGVEEVPLRGVAPQNLETWLNARIPDHVLENRSTGGPSTGSMKGVTFGTSTDAERHSEYLAHFFREIDAGIHRVPGSEDLPLILAGVVAETRLYARGNTHTRLLEDTVHGSPEKLPAKELHERALRIARHTFSKALSKTLQDMKQHRGAGRVVTDTESILKAAHAGRVADLLVREDAEGRGGWDEVKQEMLPGSQDLLNLAALQTLVHGGQAFALNSSDMPEPAGMAALLRY
jgi:hypothetical protein